MKKRMGYMKLHEVVELNIRGLTVWAYSKRGKYLGRVENQPGRSRRLYRQEGQKASGQYELGKALPAPRQAEVKPLSSTGGAQFNLPKRMMNQ